MKLSDLRKAYFLNGRLKNLQEVLEDIEQGASPTLKIATEENVGELWLGEDDMRVSLCGFIRAEIDKHKNDLTALGVDVEG